MDKIETSKTEWAMEETQCMAWTVQHKATSETKISVAPTTEEDSEVATTNVAEEVEAEAVAEEDTVVDNTVETLETKTTRPSSASSSINVSTFYFFNFIILFL